MKKFLFCVIAVVSFTFAANDELLEKLSDEALQDLLVCNSQAGMVDENCKKKNALWSERMAKLSKEDQEKVRDLTAAKFMLETEKAKKKDEERVKLREERAKAATPTSLADSNDAVEKLAEEMIDLLDKCDNKQLDENECKKQKKLLSEREKKLSALDQKKLQDLLMPKFIEMVKKRK